MAKGEGKGKGVVGCLICVSLILGVGLSVVALVGLFVAIWQCADLLSTNDELMSLARQANGDDRLLHAYYVFIAFTIIAQILSCVGGKNRHGGEDNEVTRHSSCLGAFFSLVLVAGHLASGLLGVLYRDEVISGIQGDMEGLLVNGSYINPDSGDLSRPDYTKTGEYFNFLQTKYKCCGVRKIDAGDYRDAKFQERYNMPFPYSCCTLKDRKNTYWRRVNLEDVENWNRCKEHTPSYFYEDTCYKIERDWLQKKANFIIGYNFALLALSVGTFTILLLIILCAVCCK